MNQDTFELTKKLNNFNDNYCEINFLDDLYGVDIYKLTCIWNDINFSYLIKLINWENKTFSKYDL